jgi:hypothetical protein
MVARMLETRPPAISCEIAKVRRGRLSGPDGMDTHSAGQLYTWAEDLDVSARSPEAPDDPRWLRRWAGRIRQLADKKVKARVHRFLDRRGKHHRISEDSI